MESCIVQAADGELGKVKDIYFDSEKWAIRYLVIDTRRWLPGKKVLVSPIAFDTVQLAEERISIAATQEQIKNSPAVDEHEPISRKKEKEINGYYGWAPYWTGGGVWGHWFSPNQIARFSPQMEEYPDELGPESDEQTNLRSANELKGMISGYTVKAIDEDVGKVEDFILDDDSWRIHYLIVDTGDWLPGKKILLSPESIVAVDWSNKEVILDLEAKDLEHKPEYTPDSSDSFNALEADVHQMQQEKIYHVRNNYLE